MLRPKILYFVSEDWFFCSHWIPIALAAKNNGYDVHVLTKVVDKNEIIIGHGFVLHHIGLDRSGINPYHELKSLFSVIRIYRDVKPNLVHHIGLKQILYGSIATLFSQKPIAFNAVVGLGYVFSSRQLKARFVRFFLKKLLTELFKLDYSGIFVENYGLSRVLVEQFRVDAKKIFVIPGAGVNIDLFHPVKESHGNIVVVMVSRMLWDKGVGEFVRAASILKKRNPSVVMKLVGEPDPKNPESVSLSQINKWRDNGVIENFAFQG